MTTILANLLARLTGATWTTITVVEQGKPVTRRVLMQKPLFRADSLGNVTHS